MKTSARLVQEVSAGPDPSADRPGAARIRADFHPSPIEGSARTATMQNMNQMSSRRTIRT
ncbi:MAG: hypothetical protein ABIK36_16440 [Pseudomonadota bacterium]